MDPDDDCSKDLAVAELHDDTLSDFDELIESEWHPIRKKFGNGNGEKKFCEERIPGVGLIENFSAFQTESKRFSCFCCLSFISTVMVFIAATGKVILF